MKFTDTRFTALVEVDARAQAVWNAIAWAFIALALAFAGIAYAGYVESGGTGHGE